MNAPAVEPGARQPQPWPMSVEAYHALGELGLIPRRTELLYGTVYTKMPKSPLHSFLVLRLGSLLSGKIPTECHLRPEQPLTCADSEPEPDFAVVRGKVEAYRHAHPRTAELVIEVCVTSHEYDREKLRAYAGAGVRECWLILGPEKQIEFHREPAEGVYRENVVHGPGGRIASRALPGLEIDLPALFQD